MHIEKVFSMFVNKLDQKLDERWRNEGIVRKLRLNAFKNGM